MSIRLNGATSGSIEIDVPAVAGTDTAITIPATSGGEFIVSDSAGDVNIDSGTLFVDASADRVGIGTTSPSVLVDCEGSSSSEVALHLNNVEASGANTILTSTGSTYSYADVGSGTSWLTTGGTKVAVGPYTAGSLQFINGDEKARIDSSGALLIDTNFKRTGFFNSSSTYGSNFNVEGANSNQERAITFVYGDDSGGDPMLLLAKHRSTSTGLATSSMASVQDTDGLGIVSFQGKTGDRFCEGARIASGVDGTPGTNDLPAFLRFLTNSGGSSPLERMRLSPAGRFYLSGGWYNTYTTQNAANVYSASSGEFYRVSSSLKYKTDVETIQDSYSDAILNIRPVWYRSLSEVDNSDHSWWGFIAEEVAEVDPRLVQWKTVDVAYDENGYSVETPCDPEPEGVAYDRFVPHLVNLIKRQKEAIETLEANNVSLEAKVTALETQNASFEARLAALEGGTTE